MFEKVTIKESNDVSSLTLTSETKTAATYPQIKELKRLK